MLKAKLINYAITKAKQNKFLKSIVEKPIDLNQLSIKGTFKDSDGNTFPLYNLLRSKIKPGWENYFKNNVTQLLYDRKIIVQSIERSTLEINRIEPIINTFAGGIKNKTIAEIGCHSGGVVYTFAQKGASKVIGTDYTEYKVSSSDAKDLQRANEEVNTSLDKLRSEIQKEFSHTENVSFVNDDICNTQLPPNFFDIVCSWDVLEHIHKPETAFQGIYSILKPGGIAIHEYNPFFGLNGGHSPCTLDIPWGHAVLNKADIERYCDEIQPDKKDKTLSFYYKGLNRMTIQDMKNYVERAGLNLLAFLPYTREQHLYLLNEQILRQVTKHYPTATLADLLSPRIVIVLQKPR